MTHESERENTRHKDRTTVAVQMKETRADRNQFI